MNRDGGDYCGRKSATDNIQKSSYLFISSTSCKVSSGKSHRILNIGIYSRFDGYLRRLQNSSLSIAANNSSSSLSTAPTHSKAPISHAYRRHENGNIPFFSNHRLEAT